MTLTRDPKIHVTPMDIVVRIQRLPCEGVLVQQMVLNGIASRLRIEYPASEVKVVVAISAPKGFEIHVSSEFNFNFAEVEADIRRSVQDSLDRVEADYSHKCTRSLGLTTTDSAVRIYQLEAEKKMLQVALRELASTTEYILLSSQGYDREMAQKAVAEAEGILGDFKPRYVGDGPLSLAEMIRALRNIRFDLTCDRCSSLFYTGESTGKHSDTCATEK